MKKRKIKYYLIGVIILAAAVTGLEGCVGPAQGKRQAAKALQEKYQEKFEVISFKEAGFMEDYYSVMAYSTEYPDLIFEASVDNKTGQVMDSYVTKRLCDRISDKISQNLGTLENDYYVYTKARFGDSVITDPNVSLEEYMKEDPYNKFSIYLCLDKEDADLKNISDSLIHMLNGIPGISGSASIFLGDAEFLAKVQEYVTSHDTTYNDFDQMVESAYIGIVDIENSGFFLPEENLREMAGDRL